MLSRKYDFRIRKNPRPGIQNPSESVFSRTLANSPGVEVPAQVYNLMIGLVLSWGFAVNALMVTYIEVDLLTGMSPWLFVVGYFASCFFGIYLFTTSDKPLTSFVGYNFVVVPFGTIINIVVSLYDSSSGHRGDQDHRGW